MQIEIVESSNNQPSKLPRNTGPSTRGKSILKASAGVPTSPDEARTWMNTPGLLDDEYHEQLSDRLGVRHRSPAWDVACTLEGMRLWLDRLDISEKCVEKLTATSLTEFIDLNPFWLLRAWIGLILEVTEEGAKDERNVSQCGGESVAKER